MGTALLDTESRAMNFHHYGKEINLGLIPELYQENGAWPTTPK